MGVQLKVLIPEAEIQKKVHELAHQLAEDYANKHPLALCILKGGWIFFADLIRAIGISVECDFLSVSSYGTGTVSSEKIRLRSELSSCPTGRDVLIVDDIADTGYTLHELQRLLYAQGAQDVRICVLLDKPERRKVPVHLDYVGFTLPDRFVVGYGLDYGEQYRHLSYIAILEN